MINLDPRYQHWRKTRAHLLPDVAIFHAAGISEKAMAEKLNTSRQIIKSCVKDLGLRNRSISDANRLRYANATEELRKEATHAARKARRRGVSSAETLARKSLKKQETLALVGIKERDLSEDLLAKGLEVIPQFAWKRYNFDLMVGHLAVEVHGRRERPIHSSKDLRKICEALGAGISVLYVWLDQGSYTPKVVEQIISFYNITRTNPTPLGQHWVVRGDGERDFVGEQQVDQYAAVISNYYILKTSR